MNLLPINDYRLAFNKVTTIFEECLIKFVQCLFLGFPPITCLHLNDILFCNYPLNLIGLFELLIHQRVNAKFLAVFLNGFRVVMINFIQYGMAKGVYFL